MNYKGTTEPVPQIAHELNVDGIVEGTVQRSGDRVRITAQLIYGPADRHLWAQSFERDVKDMLALQGAVASEIVGNRGQSNSRSKPNCGCRPVNPKALDAYVEARFHMDQVGRVEFYKRNNEHSRKTAAVSISTGPSGRSIICQPTWDISMPSIQEMVLIPS
jgi:hypothetical protein